MNPEGRPANLVAKQAGNSNAARHYVYSPRLLAPRGREVADALLGQPHVKPLDQIGAEEIGSLIALAEACDRDIAERSVTDARGNARSIVALRLRISGRLERWLREFGATPASRVEWGTCIPGRGDRRRATR